MYKTSNDILLYTVTQHQNISNKNFVS